MLVTLAFLLCTAVLLWALLIHLSRGALSRLNPVSPRVWWVLVGLTLSRFWVMDLYAAKFQVVLLLLPAGLAAGQALGRGALSRLLGGIAGLAASWALLLHRSMSVGCVGVSRFYEETMLLLLALLILVAPLAIGHVLHRRPRLASLAEVFD
jgi:hypothetical protein